MRKLNRFERNLIWNWLCWDGLIPGVAVLLYPYEIYNSEHPRLRLYYANVLKKAILPRSRFHIFLRKVFPNV